MPVSLSSTLRFAFEASNDARSDSTNDWSGVLLDGWMVLCVVGFVSFALASETSRRKRQQAMTHEISLNNVCRAEGASPSSQPSQFNKKETLSSGSSSVFRRLMAASLSSVSLRSVSQNDYRRDLEEADENCEHKEQERGDEERTSSSLLRNLDASNPDIHSGLPPLSSRSSASPSSSPPPRIQRTVLFKPINEADEHGVSSPHQFGQHNSFRDGSSVVTDAVQPAPLSIFVPSTPSETSMSPNESGSRRLSFLGRRRLSRETSNNSLNSSFSSFLPRVGGSFLGLSVNSGSKQNSSSRLSELDSQPPNCTPSPSPSRLVPFSLSSPLGGIRDSMTPPFVRATMNGEENGVSDISLQLDECAVCFKKLHREPVSVCVNQEGHPSCLHLYHDRCLKALRRRSCLLCGARFKYRRRVPDVEVDPKGWFDTVDLDGSGGLSPLEIARVLAAQLPIDRPALEKLLKKYWKRWDEDGSGEVDQNEFFVPRRGLLAFIKKKRPDFKLIEPDMEVPDIRDDPKQWFEFFDNNHSGTLEKTEVLRGLIVSFGLSEKEKICLNLRSVLDAVWPVFDSDMSLNISKEEFLEPKTGLATSLIISLDLADRKRMIH